MHVPVDDDTDVTLGRYLCNQCHRQVPLTGWSCGCLQVMTTQPSFRHSVPDDMNVLISSMHGLMRAKKAVEVFTVVHSKTYCYQAVQFPPSTAMLAWGQKSTTWWDSFWSACAIYRVWKDPSTRSLTSCGKIASVTKSDLKQASIPSMSALCSQRRLRWLGHVNGRIPRDILYGELAKESGPLAKLKYSDVCTRWHEVH